VRHVGRLFGGPWGESASWEGELTGAYPVDISEEDDTLVVEAEVPGFRREDIDVCLENDHLRIAAERKTKEAKGTKHLTERRFSRVERSFTLPTSVDPDRVEAKLEDGVLTLRLPKSEEVKPKRIEVK
jgi:HSP20 family molecular chaperone IbpA